MLLQTGSGGIGILNGSVEWDDTTEVPTTGPNKLISSVLPDVRIAGTWAPFTRPTTSELYYQHLIRKGDAAEWDYWSEGNYLFSNKCNSQ